MKKSFYFTVLSASVFLASGNFHESLCSEDAGSSHHEGDARPGKHNPRKRQISKLSASLEEKGYRGPWRGDDFSPIIVGAANGDLRAVQEEMDHILNSSNQQKSETDTPENPQAILQKALFVACQNGFTGIVEHLLEKGVEPSIDSASKKTPLHIAAINGHSAVVKILLASKSGKDLANQKDESKMTALHYGAASGNEEMIKDLMAQMEDIHPENSNGITPFHSAIMEGNLSLSHLFLERGGIEANKGKINLKLLFSIISTNNEGFVVHFMERYGHLYGGSLTDLYHKGTSLLTTAIHQGNLPILKYLIEAAEKNSTPFDLKAHFLSCLTSGTTKSVEYFLGKIGLKQVDYKLDRGENLIHFLLITDVKEKAEKVKLLIDYYKASELKFLSDKEVILRRVIEDRAKEQSYGTTLHPFIQDLIDLGAIVNTPPNTTSPLHVAASKGYLEVVNVLIHNKADLMHFDQFKKTPLQIAIDNGHEEVVHLLGAASNVDTSEIESQLRASKPNTTRQVMDENFIDALLNGNLDQLTEFFQKGYIINDRALPERMKGSESVLSFIAHNPLNNKAKVMEAIIQHYKENELKLPSDMKKILSLVIGDKSKEQSYGTTLHPFIQDLINLGAKVNTPTGSDSPLHVAASKGYLEVVNVLIHNKADLMHFDQFKKTPLQIAIDNGHEEVAHLLGAASNVDASEIESQLRASKLNATRKAMDEGFSFAVLRGNLEQLTKFFQQGYIINDRWLPERMGGSDTVLSFVAKNAFKNKAQVMEAIIHHYKENGLTLPPDNKQILSRVIDDRSKEQYYGTTLHPFIQDLIDLGAKVNTRKGNPSPLHVAASKGYLEVVKVLVKNGADLMHLDYSKKTPSQVAMDNGHQEVADYLSSELYMLSLNDKVRGN